MLDIIPFQDKHLEAAAGLASLRYADLRKTFPLMSSRYEETDILLPMLTELAGNAPGVVALRAGQVVGFITGYRLPDWRGQRSTFSPEWGNGAEPGDSRRIYEEMYAHLAARWVGEGYRTHLISMLAHDRGALEGWHWLGFGLAAVDGVRALSPIPAPTQNVEIRQARPADAEHSYALLAALRAHLSAAPTFLPFETQDRAQHQDWLADPANALWIAFRGTEPIACMGQGPANPKACTVIDDKGTTSIVSAFTVEDARGSGAATALLNQALDWGKAQGYKRCAVDFEPMNLLATRFWLKAFQPVCYALRRDIDDQARGS
jgi:GNAT superfamily N-acetyltransferase